MKKELYPEFKNWDDEWEKFKEVVEKQLMTKFLMMLFAP